MNNKTAYVFPGQGSQEVGMGLQLSDKYPAAKKIFLEADEVLGFPLSKLCFEGPDDELTKTVNVQPAILTTSIACLEVASELGGDRIPIPGFVAGHSIGEYTALVASKVLSFADALKLVRERGRLMFEAGQKTAGAMLAVLGADEETVKEICAQADTEISNINSPGQIVISGSREKIAQAKIIAEGKGLRRLIPLKVSGAFHSRLMQSASEGLKDAVQGVDFHQPEIPVVSNVNAILLINPQEFKNELVTQLVSCVQWQKSVENMIASGVNIFIEFGHGQVITNLIRRINESVKVFNVSDVDIENRINAIINNI